MVMMGLLSMVGKWVNNDNAKGIAIMKRQAYANATQMVSMSSL